MWPTNKSIGATLSVEEKQPLDRPLELDAAGYVCANASAAGHWFAWMNRSEDFGRPREPGEYGDDG